MEFILLKLNKYLIESISIRTQNISRRKKCFGKTPNPASFRKIRGKVKIVVNCRTCRGSTCNSVAVSNYGIHVLNAPFTGWGLPATRTMQILMSKVTLWRQNIDIGTGYSKCKTWEHVCDIFCEKNIVSLIFLEAPSPKPLEDKKSVEFGFLRWSVHRCCILSPHLFAGTNYADAGTRTG